MSNTWIYSAEKSAADVAYSFEQDATDVISFEAGCIALTGTFTGNREPRNWCYLSDFQVESVLLGDNSLAGQTIRVYEPVAYEKISEENVDFYLDGQTEGWSQMQEKFHYGSKDGVNYWLNAAMNTGMTMFVEGERYLILIKERDYHPEMDRPEVPEYTFLVSPYAKFNLKESVPVEEYAVPDVLLSFEETMDYEILVNDKALYKRYVEEKAKLLERFGLA